MTDATPFADTPDDALIAASNRLVELHMACLERGDFIKAGVVTAQRNAVDSELRRRGLLPTPTNT